MEIQLKNYMEDAVMQYLTTIMTQIGCCTCDICKMDVAAIALNNLKPSYVVSKEGTLYARTTELASQHSADIIAAVTKGVEIVKVRPRHE